MKTFTYLSLICCALCFISCGDDPIIGCIDPAAANYDPEATESSDDCTYPGCTDEEADNYSDTANQDDGTCTYFDRFVGKYTGQFDCVGQLAGILNEADSEIIKTAGNNNQDSITVFVGNSETDISFVLGGNITKDKATIDTYIPNFEYTVEFMEFVVEGPFEVTVTGELTRMEDGSLSGPVTMSIVKAEVALALMETCNYTATKN